MGPGPPRFAHAALRQEEKDHRQAELAHATLEASDHL